MDECTSSSVSSVMAEAEETATKTPKFSNKFIIEWNKCICTKQGPKLNSRGKQAYLSWLVFIIKAIIHLYFTINDVLHAIIVMKQSKVFGERCMHANKIILHKY